MRDLYETQKREAAWAQERREQERYATARAQPGSVTITYTDGRKETRRGNHPQRDNNPGNMEWKGGFAGRHGGIGGDKGIAIFPSAETGWAAMDARLRSDEFWNLTIDQAIYKWAPPRNAQGKVINNTSKYQADIRAALGVRGDTQISALRPEQFEALKQAIAKFEGFYEKRPGKKVDIVVAVPDRPGVIRKR